MGKGLFRDEAIKETEQSLFGTIQLSVPLHTKALTIICMLTLCASLVWAIAGKYTRRINVSGTLMPANGAHEIVATTSGVIRAFKVREGEPVKEGDPICSIQMEITNRDGQNIYQQAVDVLKRERAELVGSLQSSQALETKVIKGARDSWENEQAELNQIKIEENITNQAARREAATIALWRAPEFATVISGVQMMREENTLGSYEAQISNLAQKGHEIRGQILSLEETIRETPSTYDLKFQDLRRQIAAIDGELANATEKSSSVVKATSSGIVSAILKHTGDFVVAGAPVVSLSPPDDPLEAEVLLPSSAVGFVHAGTTVSIRVEAFPFEKFGGVDGIVSSISAANLTPVEVNELNTGPRKDNHDSLYMVKIRLLRQEISIYGENKRLRFGMQIRADIRVEKRSILEWIFAPLLKQ